MLRTGGYRIVTIRLMLALIFTIGGLASRPVAARPLAVEALCHTVTRAATADSALPTLPFACRTAPVGYQHDSLWLRADLRRFPVDRGDLTLMVHQSRFDRLAVAFTYADGHVVWQRVAGGAFGTRWRVGGQIAFEAPARDVPLVAVTMRFDHLASDKLLRIRVATSAEAGAQAAMLAALTGAALTLLLIGAVYNLSLAAAVRRQFLLWHGAWAACVFIWGIIWSQIELLVAPGLAGATAAQICTFLACLAITAATVSAATSVGRGVVPRWASIVTMAFGIIVGLVGIPAALIRDGSIDWVGDLLGVFVLADLVVVALFLGWAWRRRSSDARDVAMAWSVPMAALGLTQVVDVGSALWGGGAQLLVLFAAALQTLWLAVATTRRFSRLRVERDHARAAEARASELAGRDPLTDLYNRRGFKDRLGALLGEMRPVEAPVALLLIDVDRFKAINDAFGHEAGDVVLCRIAQRLLRWEGNSCAVARLGGEEFALAIVGIDGFALARFADGVRQELAGLDHGTAIGGRAVTVSIGVIQARGPCTFQQLYRLADKALYAAKQSGRDRIVLQDMDASAGVAPTFSTDRIVAQLGN
ncbi:MAG TPA: diguanylate cyclase [Sphingomonas sp.]|nr:diguanylate cyclase [Sphingomonas sp.]